METYRDTVVKVIDQQQQPVILVGHSFGGMVISSVAEAVPDKIQMLVYLAAYVPQSGDNLLTLSSLDHYSAWNLAALRPSAKFLPLIALR